MPHKAVIFDLDGTLLDTLADIGDSMNAVLSRGGFPSHTLENYKYLVGEGIEILARNALPEAHRDETTVAKSVAAMRAEYAAHWADKTRIYPGMNELLEALTKRSVPLAVLSNKPHDFTNEMVKRYFPRTCFASIYGARASVAKKPDPVAALQIARELSLAPAEVLFVGDTRIDMETATRAGMTAIGALWGFRTADELTRSGAKALIATPLELMNHL